jgi:predicted RNase H-like nuclease (RuvC/YqgF family)
MEDLQALKTSYDQFVRDFGVVVYRANLAAQHAQEMAQGCRTRDEEIRELKAELAVQTANAERLAEELAEARACHSAVPVLVSPDYATAGGLSLIAAQPDSTD